MSHYCRVKDFHTERLQGNVLGVALLHSSGKTFNPFKCLFFLNMHSVPFTSIKFFVCWQERRVPIFTARRPWAVIKSVIICHYSKYGLKKTDDKGKCTWKQKYLLVSNCCMHLSHNFFTVDRALQGVDNVVEWVVLIIIQYTVVHIVYCPVWIEKDNINVVWVV